MSLNLASRFLRSSTASLRAGTASVSRSFHNTTSRGQLYENANLETFEKTIAQKDRVTIVDFYADWCGPCRQLSPVLEKLTEDPHKSSNGLPYDLVKVDVDSDDGQALAQKYGVSAMPTVLAFLDKTKLQSFRGSIPEPAVKKFLEEL